MPPETGDQAATARRRGAGQADDEGAAAAIPAATIPAAAPAEVPKARLRGAIHHYAAFVSAGIGIMLILEAQSKRAQLGCAIYTLSTTCMFSVSASYHRPNWGPGARALWRRLDHAAIFMLIAGTNTPLALLALEPAQSARLLSIVWGGAAAGMAQCLFFSHAPKALAASLYVLLGWVALPFLEQYKAALPAVDVFLIVAGGVIYSAGALVYALRRPDPVPHVFGYHEIFHTLVTLAALLHFAAVHRVVNSPALGRGLGA